jgi:Na+-transporting NADH:ubiquinone oxidoreductase subunit A
MIKTKRGLELPIGGAPQQVLTETKKPRTVAVLGPDFVGMKPTMAVVEGERIKCGQTLFAAKKTSGLVFTAPAAGTVAAINRGAKRALQSVVIDVDGEQAEEFVTGHATKLSRDEIVSNLVASGLWVSFRTRPFSRVPALDAQPQSIFVTAMDTNPLAADPLIAITERAEAFADGLDMIAELTSGKVFICQAAGKFLPNGHNTRLVPSEFAGVHPAGLAGTHIHFLDPVGAGKTVWTIGYQDVIAVGHLFQTGALDSTRIVALGGPSVIKPRLIKTLLGASTDELVAGELKVDEESRVISGSVLAGHTATGPLAFLGRYHQQVSVLAEDRQRRLLGYLTPGVRKHSVLPIYLSGWGKRKTLEFTTTLNGGVRGMVPLGTYDKMMPQDILATQLMRALLVGDVERAINLGCLELDEEDVALCTYACPGKYEFGPVLRNMLNQIEKEG